MSVSLTFLKVLEANSISVIDNTRVFDLQDVCLSELYDIHSIVGLPMSTLNSLQQLAEAINSDDNFLNDIMASINLKVRFSIC